MLLMDKNDFLDLFYVASAGQDKRFVEAVEMVVSDTPTIDAAPVVHGRWDDSLDGITPYCTVCGRSHRGMQRTPNYCPNCGTKMDGDTK